MHKEYVLESTLRIATSRSVCYMRLLLHFPDGSNAAFSDASFPNLRYNSAVERDNGIEITHTKTQQTNMKVHVNVALCGSASWVFT